MPNSKIAFLRSALRRASTRWGPIWKTKLAARRPYAGPNKRQKYEYECSTCKKCFPNSKVQVHHKVPAGTIRVLEDLPAYVDRLLCDQDDLALVCLGCHKLSHR